MRPQLLLIVSAKPGELRFGGIESHKMCVRPMLSSVFIFCCTESGEVVCKEGVPKAFYLIELYAELALNNDKERRGKDGTPWCATWDFDWV
jgi:hypothetical protein